MGWLWLGLGLAFGLAGCDGGAPVEPPAPTLPAPAPEDPDIASVPATPPPPRELRVDRGDLDAVKASHQLRVLVMGDGEIVLPRDGESSATDRELAALFAKSLGLEVEPIAVDRYEDLIPYLLDGKGDLVASRMAVTASREAKVKFSRPTAVVSELLVGRKGADNPRSPAELAGKTITVRPSSSYRESLDRLAQGDGKGLVVADAAEDRDTESLVHDVGTGALALTVCDSDLFAHIAAYDDQVEALFPVAEGRQIAWAIRPDNPKLLAAADAFLVSWAMTTHAQKMSTGDLAEIKKRGSLRVLTRNNATSYFLHQGTQSGFDYELMKRFATDNGLRLDVIVPPDADQLLPWLLQGKGDVIAAQWAVTEDRAKQAAFSDPYQTVDEVVVQKAGEPPLTSLAELKGRTLAVRKSSSYRRTLDALQATAGPFTIQDVPEDLETEQIIAKVASGELPMTVSDSNLAAVELAYGVAVQTTLKLTEHEPIAYAVRKENPTLLSTLNQWIAKTVDSVDYRVIYKRYFEDPRTIAGSHTDMLSAGRISPFDDLLRQHSREYGLDWRLMASQAYQESRFDPAAHSWCGALGLFQVMPITGKELGFDDLTQPEQGIAAGIHYVSRLIDQFDKSLPFKQRVRFALAAYNAGKGHVDDARRLAKELHLDPDKWFGNVEVAMTKLSEQPYARKARYGYCRGEEPVHYVSEIQSRYENYLTVVKDLGQ